MKVLNEECSYEWWNIDLGCFILVLVSNSVAVSASSIQVPPYKYEILSAAVGNVDPSFNLVLT